jgi:putative ABC transport system permease protein
MRERSLIARSLGHYWRTNLAVVAGVGLAVAVLAGALVVGDSVRGSLRDLALRRLGRTDVAITASRPVPDELAARLSAAPSFAEGFERTAPLLSVEGVVTAEDAGRRAGGVLVHGVDERFWTFHGLLPPELRGRSAILGESLAAELGVSVGDAVLLRLEQSSAVSGATLFGRRDDMGVTLRLTVAGTRPAEALGEFALRPRQQAVHALFLPLATLQRALGQAGRVNAVLLQARAPASAPSSAAVLLREAYALEDLGLRVRGLPEREALALESESALLSDELAGAAGRAAQTSGLEAQPVLTYLANAIRARGREVPYSVVAAIDEMSWRGLVSASAPAGEPPIVLNDWTARDLGAQVGDPVTLEYYVWEEEGRLRTAAAEFRLAAVVPMTGLAADRDLTPEYPGITASQSMGEWDPPFPIDLARVRPRDEEYWKRYRATPKAFVPLEAGQRLWRHRLGALTSMRVSGRAASPERFTAALRGALDPLAFGLAVAPVRAEALRAAEGATDFGAYFLYFSSFLVWAALLLAALFFRFGVEQRLREVGLLRALGFTPRAVSRLFLAEGLLLSVLGSLLGVAGAVAYGGLLLRGLRTVWVDAVGTRELALHVAPSSLALGALGGVASALLCLALTLRGLRRTSPRALLTGSPGEARLPEAPSRRAGLAMAAAAGLAVVLLTAAGTGRLPAAGAFFGAGALLLAAAVTGQWRWLRARPPGVPSAGTRGLAWLGARSASYRPGRSALCVALIASATFVIVSVGAFRRGPEGSGGDPHGPDGGYALVATSLLPVHHDPATAAGRAALNLTGEGAPLENIEVARFRMQSGDDASCLNLYRPQRPTLLAPTADFLRAGRFSFQRSLAVSAEEHANPWLLLEREDPDGALPVIGDAASLQYVMHREVGDVLTLEREGATPLRLRVMAALRDSLFQGELLMGERAFLRAFPEQQGYRFFLIAAPADQVAAVAGALESRLADLGFDATLTAERLERYHRVENTYLSTFQALGALGLLLGTAGLGAVLLRNALERRRELALLRAVGYRGRDLGLMVLAENALLLLLGLGTGAACALVAIAPALMERGGRVPVMALAALLVAVATAGLVVSALAVAAVNRMPLLASLRAE